ncbi:hypothetical protein [Tranquillimonas rosea]|uniref:hypothetical protein n=1 Tax=Tranquillimonas rosea TaxID=641238 RepID=UPI003BAC68BB
MLPVQLDITVLKEQLHQLLVLDSVLLSVHQVLNLKEDSLFLVLMVTTYQELSASIVIEDMSALQVQQLVIQPQLPSMDTFALLVTIAMQELM